MPMPPKRGIGTNSSDCLMSCRRKPRNFSKTHREAADRVARCAEAFAQEANRAEHNHRLLKLAVEDLKKSVEQFETSHPRLVQIVGTISATLANMGI